MATSNQLKERRNQLKSQRRQKVWQSIARFACITAMAAGLSWAMSLPYWSIASADQIEVRGNHLLSAELIRNCLKVSYPKSIWRLSTSPLTANLAAIPPIASVEVSRQLLPPKIIVTVAERQPVALIPAPRNPSYLDDRGVVIPLSYYSRTPFFPQSPPLKVIGYQNQYQTSWQKLYSLLGNFPVKISSVNWQEPSNLVLDTSLGKVYLGANDNLLVKKLNTLARIAQVNGKVATKDILYVDLRNPDSPSIQLKPKVDKIKEKESI
ncbi:MAG: Cell division protein FtsQ [Chroococcopsis gigantea SAG 12.99]|jgi:cell division protein FtsQ|nr:FtsQ-type POTRA domain-containing protein [Chlorogloea purpurea SAG 13.99]MDV2998909.1 Cell division protein FtsQ [Chroococcopsis gigantea SAG 12.99]